MRLICGQTQWLRSRDWKCCTAFLWAYLMLFILSTKTFWLLDSLEAMAGGHFGAGVLPLCSKTREIKSIPLYCIYWYIHNTVVLCMGCPFFIFLNEKTETRARSWMWNASFYSFRPTGEHLNCGLRWRGAHLLPWPLCGIWLHLFWHHPQWHAHLHSIQQVFRLLRQTEGAGIHSFEHGAHLSANETSETQVE